MGGCMNTGGVCIGCTMPGFPDRFAPFYAKPPGSNLSTGASRLVGTFIRPLRRFTQTFQNREPRWDREGHVPTGWGHVAESGPIQRFIHYLYQKYQFLGTKDPSARRSGGAGHVEQQNERDARGGV
jgi:hydrogenase small subunit